MVNFFEEVKYGFFLFAITTTLVGYYAYYYLSHSALMKRFFSRLFSGDNFWLRWVLFQKATGFIFMAFFPALLYLLFFDGSLTDFGLSLHHLQDNWKWLAFFLIFFILLNSFLARKAGLMEQYPQMRINSWTRSRFILSAFGWILYLLAYEYLFRGLLLFSAYEAFGVWPAIAINVAIYSAVHFPKGMGETLGAIPFGILSCILALSTGTILIPFAAHASLAVSMEYFAIKYNPEMNLMMIKSKRKIR
jgi:membrane protease YdiL (CAAX protease family)